MLKKILSLVLTLFASLEVCAQVNDTINIIDDLKASGTITVVQPNALTDRLKPDHSQPATTTSSSASYGTGKKMVYRVEVFSDNNMRTAKSAARQNKSLADSRLPQYRSYVLFESPYWRVHIGDFRTRAEAEEALATIKRALPSLSSAMRIVKDKVSGGF